MVVAFGFWSLELTPGNEEIVVPPEDVRITNVSLGDVLVDPTGRSTIKITYSPLGESYSMEDESEDEEEVPSEKTTVLCSLTAGKLEHVTTDLVLEKDEAFKFIIVGKNSVYLSGNYIDQETLNNPPYDGSDIGSDEGEWFSGEDMDSDEMTDASRFKEVDDEPPATLKRGREPETTAEHSKVEKKNKKLKAADGKAVPADTGKKDEAKQEKKAKTDEKLEVEKKDEKKKEGKKEKKGKKADAAEEQKAKSAEQELPGGLKFVDATTGEGPVAKKGNFVAMRYIGKLQSGKIFDKNVKGSPFSFRLGKGEVIKGWDEGIVGMRIGGERKLTIPPAMAYGKKGTDGIPPNSTLIFGELQV
ncbi:hypothetical protein M378DRAFT_184727 [Amanita muscaria Koide BX008]|uniref:FK506-binding protein n=1 Tax=Amanita muscaria (strain Koide BX008) TaxID=946122 RepID=A0A0C2XIP4_AMAMK|nr:hypothetical protein M378DRAFT_184727 [Amanita muscaria Koide BX008]